MSTDACRACGAPLVWVVTPNGKRVPLNTPEHSGVDLGSSPGLKGLYPEVMGYDAHGVVRRISKAPLGLEGRHVWTTVRVTHFADCPQREQFRRRR